MKLDRLLLALAAGALACDYGGGEGKSQVVSGCGELAAAGIDTAAELEITPGEGVGVFFEYLGEGAWRVTTTCDTATSGDSCYWDVLVTAGEGVIADFGSLGLEGGDAIGYEYNGTLHFITDTGADADAMLITATPGEALTFEAYLDGYCASPYMFWIGEGAVHGGSPGNPLELLPSE